MNINLNLPQEKVEAVALFIGAVLIASTISQSAYFFIQNNFPPSSVHIPIWSFAWSWLIAIYMVTQVHNNLLRVAILSWVISKVALWSLSGSWSMAALVIHNGFYFLAGVLMVSVGVRKNNRRSCFVAFLLMAVLALIQYHALQSWAKTLETITRH